MEESIALSQRDGGGQCVTDGQQDVECTEPGSPDEKHVDEFVLQVFKVDCNSIMINGLDKTGRRVQCDQTFSLRLTVFRFPPYFCMHMKEPKNPVIMMKFGAKKMTMSWNNVRYCR